MAMVMGNVEDEICFSNLRFKKSKLKNIFEFGCQDVHTNIFYL
jgi:hypothetical protein